MTSPSLVLSRPSERVALIEFNRPERLNPLDQETAALLLAALAEVESDTAVRAVVVTGRGGTFSAGGDIDRIAETPKVPEAEIAAGLTERFQISQTMYDSAKLYVAALSGPVVGGGFGLAMACDLRVGDATAMFLAPFSKMGLVPDYGLSWLLPRAVGKSAALDIALIGDRIDATEAHRLGLLNRIVDDPQAEALRIAELVAARPAFGVEHTKRLANAALNQPFAAGLAGEIETQARAFHDPVVQQQIAQYTQSIGSRKG